MRRGLMAAAVVAASVLLASCGNGTADSGTVGTGTVVPASSTSTAASTTSRTSPTTTTPAATPLLPPSGTGAYGYVTAGPTCPVEKPGQPCLPRPVSAGIDAHNASGATVASTRSDSSGRYALELAAGTYTVVVVVPSGLPRCPETSVAIHPGSATRADISCDTGIR
jgi:hypothetical protein